MAQLRTQTLFGLKVFFFFLFFFFFNVCKAVSKLSLLPELLIQSKVVAFITVCKSAAAEQRGLSWELTE